VRSQTHKGLKFRLDHHLTIQRAMPDLADPDLSELVQSALPLRDGGPWRVELVDFPDQATAYRKARVIRVQRSWRQAIFETGLSHVTRYYPLALSVMHEEELPVSLILKKVKIYSGPTLSRIFKSGRFTGQLRLSNSYIAETVDGCRYAADNMFSATKCALTESRTRTRRHGERLKANTCSRRCFQKYVTERASRAGSDPGFMCSLAPFANLLPERILKSLTLYGDQSAPLAALSRESIAAIDEILIEKLPTLIFELDRAMHAAEQDWKNCQPAFTAEDLAALESLGDYNRAARF
jgi:hypothetical protein